MGLEAKDCGRQKSESQEPDEQEATDTPNLSFKEKVEIYIREIYFLDPLRPQEQAESAAVARKARAGLPSFKA